MSFIAQQDFSQIWRAVNNLAVDPVKNILYYTFPISSAFFSGYSAIDPEDTSLYSSFPKESMLSMKDELSRIQRAANFSRSINLYTSFAFRPTSRGGKFSITAPFIHMPVGLLSPLERAFNESVPPRKPAHFSFTADETRFFIAREVENIKRNVSLFRTVAKLLLIAAAFFFHTTAIGLIGAAVITAIAGMIYFAADRYYEGRADLRAVDILAKTYDANGILIGKERAIACATSALEKIRQQNLERRNGNQLAKLYIRSSGNNWLDCELPFITDRIAKLRAIREQMIRQACAEEPFSAAPC